VGADILLLFLLYPFLLCGVDAQNTKLKYVGRNTVQRYRTVFCFKKYRTKYDSHTDTPSPTSR
jgi:hypothetical protein